MNLHGVNEVVKLFVWCLMLTLILNKPPCSTFMQRTRHTSVKEK